MQEILDFDQYQIDDANQYLASNSIMFKENMENETISYVPAPVSLRPSPFSREVYETLRSNQTEFNLMLQNLMNISKHLI